MFKCAHISDIHFRSLKRHDEYKIVFEKLFKKLDDLKPNIIFIGGDIVHSKTQGITPELIDQLNWWFTSLANIAPTHIILGNHDGLILNGDRQDAISPIISALNNKNLFLYKNSGVYKTGIENINWCVFSVFDKNNWDKVIPEKDAINIACYHGAVYGSKTDIDWEISGEVMLDMFKGFDFAFLGDIHKMQFLDQEKRVAYPGSTIQQNYGEDIKKGFLFWEINNKNDYKTTFYNIENPFSHITIDWKDSLDETIEYLKYVKNNLRYRIKSNKEISQFDIKLIHNYLKNEKNASEIVYQINDEFDDQLNRKIIDDNNIIKNLSVKDEEQRLLLLKEYFNDSLSEEELNNINKLFKANLEKLDHNDDYSNINWSINNMTFSNTFSYGKDNYINFNNLNGVIGLFGKNTVGKSSIPGTLMYGLFNSSDRGLTKNIDIINTRKGDCNVKIDFSIGSDNYTIYRTTTKKTIKKTNEAVATTTLKLINKNKDLETTDETDEQRRETEKILRKLIGTSEDFLYTTFASQGNINSFIDEKSNARKSVLSKFLNLDIFEELFKVSREDFSLLKNKIKSFDEKNWQQEIISLNKENCILNEEYSKNNQLLISSREIELNKKIELNSLLNNNKKHVSGYTKTSANNELETINHEIKINEKLIYDLIEEKDKSIQNIEKINNFKINFPKQELENDKQRLTILRDKLYKFDLNIKSLNKQKEKSENEIKILYDIPCGDQFKTCKFIKNAYETKDQLPEISSLIKNITGDLLEIKNTISNIEKDDIENKLNKFDELVKKEYKLNLDIQNIDLKIENIKNKLSTYQNKKLILENIILELDNFEDINNTNKEIELKNEISKLSQLISNIENENKNKIINITKNEQLIILLNDEKNEFDAISKEYKIYSIFSDCINKKGIPTMLINSYLPKINKEVNKILNGVVDFTIEICDNKNDYLNIFIDYGDSKRVIECCSGMEKMISSIALRVALINISSLSKSNMFIIDEGFGALDESNIESCNKLLKSLKKYFKTIIVISHIDSIKEMVDKSIEITKKGNDSYVRFE